ncbi:NFX1-type zinc finger-containing protein 1 [Durusdinium trenchii]|uniref:NFX1-type zinc finger-containing protein 1 n=1 Tax=Durusdinium trenchii TaxID=1381693 RepID=A0ABP0LM88_9DINO
MACAEEEEIQNGSRPMPRCDKTSHTPYVYPDCKHTREVTCYFLAEYKREPSKVPKCEHLVEYLPDCGHCISVKCSFKSAYLRSAAQFVCPQKLDIDLPRCGHPAKVSCAEEQSLRSWTGGLGKCVSAQFQWSAVAKAPCIFLIRSALGSRSMPTRGKEKRTKTAKK